MYKKTSPYIDPNQHTGQQPLPMQTLPLHFQQQQPMMPQPMQQEPMQQESSPMNETMPMQPLMPSPPQPQPFQQSMLPMQPQPFQQTMLPMQPDPNMQVMPTARIAPFNVPVVQFTDYEHLPYLGDIPITAESLQYLNGFLRTQIGRRVKVEFLIGTNTFMDKDGILIGVGVNYILINETDTDDITACDFYNIKFIKFYF